MESRENAHSVPLTAVREKSREVCVDESVAYWIKHAARHGVCCRVIEAADIEAQSRRSRPRTHHSDDARAIESTILQADDDDDGPTFVTVIDEEEVSPPGQAGGDDDNSPRTNTTTATGASYQGDAVVIGDEHGAINLPSKDSEEQSSESSPASSNTEPDRDLFHNFMCNSEWEALLPVHVLKLQKEEAEVGAVVPRLAYRDIQHIRYGLEDFPPTNNSMLNESVQQRIVTITYKPTTDDDTTSDTVERIVILLSTVLDTRMLHDGLEVIREHGADTIIESAIPQTSDKAGAQTQTIPIHLIVRAKEMRQRMSSNLLRLNPRRSLEIIGPTIASVEEEAEDEEPLLGKKRFTRSTSAGDLHSRNTGALGTREAHILFAQSFNILSPPQRHGRALSSLNEEQEKKDWAGEDLNNEIASTGAPKEGGGKEKVKLSPNNDDTKSHHSKKNNDDTKSHHSKKNNDDTKSHHSKKTAATPDAMKIEETAELYELWESCAEWSSEQMKSMAYTTGIPWKKRLELWPRLLGIDDEPIIFRDDVEKSIIDEIEKDVHRTFPEVFSDLHRRSLRRILISYAATHRSVGYCQSMNLICGVFLIVGFDDETTLKMLIKVLDVYCPGYHSLDLSGVYRDSGVIEVLLAHRFPEIYKKMAYANIPVIWVVSEHLMTMCCREWPLQTVLRLWDVFMAFGPAAVISAILAMVDLYFPAEFSLNRRMTDKALDALIKKKESTSKRTYEEPETLNSPHHTSLDPSESAKSKSQTPAASRNILNFSWLADRLDKRKIKRLKSKFILRDPAEILYAFRRNAKDGLMTQEGAQTLIQRIRELQYDITMEIIDDLRSQL